MPETNDLFPEVALRGWDGFQQLGKGALFIAEGEDYPLYVKQEYAPLMELLDDKQKSLIVERLQKYDPEKQVVVFYLNQLLVFDIFDKTGKTCEKFVKSLNRPKKPRS